MRRQASGKEGSPPEIDIILPALRASLLLPPRIYASFAKKVAIDGWRASLPVLLESLRDQLRQNYDMGPFCRTKNVRGGKLEVTQHDGQNEKRSGDLLAALHVLTSLCRLKENVTAKESTDVGELLIALLPFLQPSVRAIQMLIAILTDSIAHGLSKKMQLLLVKSLRTALRDEQQLQAARRPDFSEEETHKRYGGDIFMDAFAEEHKSTSRLVGRSVRPHCYFTLGCRRESSHESSANRPEAAATQQDAGGGGGGGGRILLPPADLHQFRGYTFTCWLHLEGGTKATMPSSGRQSPGLSVPSGLNTDNDGHMLLFRLRASPPSDCAVEVYLSRHSVGGGVRKLTILTSSSESGVEWKMTKGEVMLPPDRWVLFTMSHSLPYIQRSKVMVLINGVLQFEKYQLYPQERPSMHISAVGGFWQRQPRSDESEREREQQPLLPQNSVVSNQPSHGHHHPAPPITSQGLPPSPTKKREDGRSCFAGEGFVGKVGSIVLYGEALTMDLVNLLFHAGPDYTSLQLPIAVPPDPHHSWNATVGIALCEGDMVKAAAKAPLIFAFDPGKASTNTLCGGGEATSRQSYQRDGVSDEHLGNGHKLGKGAGPTKPSGSTGDATWQEVWVEESRLHGKLSSFPIKGPVKLPMYSNSNVGHSSRMLILSDIATMDVKRIQGTTFARLDGSVRVVKYPNWPNLWYQTGGVQSILAIVSQLCDLTSSRGSSFRAGKEYQDGSGTDVPHELCNLALITEMTYFLGDLLGRSPTLREDCLQCKGIYLLASCFKQIRVPPPRSRADPNRTMIGAETTTLPDDCAPLLHLAKATWMLIQVLGHEWFRPPRHWLGPSASGINNVYVGAPPQLLTQAMSCLWCDWGFWGRTPWLVQKWLLEQQRNMAFDMASTANNRLSMLIPIPALLFMLRTHFLPDARTPQGPPSGVNVKTGDQLPHPDVSSHPTLSRCEKIQGVELLGSIIKYVLIGDLMAVCVMKELRSFEELSDVLVFDVHDGSPSVQKASASRLVGSSLPSGSETLGLRADLTKKVARQKTRPDKRRDERRETRRDLG
jgi:hypothetical protein